MPLLARSDAPLSSVEPGVEQVDELGVGDDVGVLLEERGKLWRGCVVLVLAGLGFTREVVDLHGTDCSGPNAEATDQVGTHCLGVLLELFVELLHCGSTRSTRVLHDLNETGVVGASGEEFFNVLGVRERNRAVEALLGFGPPRALLGALTVGARRGRRFETSDGEPDSIVAHTAGAAQKAGRARTKVGLPSIELATQPGLVGDLALDDLYKHDVLHSQHCDARIGRTILAPRPVAAILWSASLSVPINRGGRKSPSFDRTARRTMARVPELALPRHDVAERRSPHRHARSGPSRPSPLLSSPSCRSTRVSMEQARCDRHLSCPTGPRPHPPA